MTTLQIRIDDDLRAFLDQRTAILGYTEDRGRGTSGRAATVRHDLAWFYATLVADLRAAALTEPEALAILDAMNGWMWDIPGDTNIQPALLLQIEDAIRLELLAEKWRLDGDAFLAKLAALSPGQCYAILDAGRAAWAMTDGDMRERAHAVGLVAG